MFVPYGCSKTYSKKLKSKLSTNDQCKFDQIQTLVYNLSKNGKHLVNTYTPEQLISLNDYTLRDTETEKPAAECAYENLTRDIVLLNEEINCIKCKYCRKDTVTFTTKQTRSADEGSTVFAICLNPTCMKRWKM